MSYKLNHTDIVLHVWILSPSTMLLRFIHGIICVSSSSFFFFYCWAVFHYRYNTICYALISWCTLMFFSVFFVYYEHSYYEHLQASVYVDIFFSLGKMTKSDIIRSHGRFMFKFIRHSQTVFQITFWNILFGIFTWNIWEFQFFYTLANTWFCQEFLT